MGLGDNLTTFQQNFANFALMKTSLKILLVLLILGLTIVSVIPAFAQCAQCAAAVKTNAANGSVTAKGLNDGIYVLLCAPYLAVAIGGFVWYKKYKRKDVNLEVHSEKLHLN